MKKVIVFAMLLVFGLTLGAYALQVAYVDREEVFSAYDGTKKAKEKLQKELELEQKELEKERDAILAARKDLDKKRSVLDKKKAEEMEMDIAKKTQALQQKTMEIQQKLLSREKEMYAQILKEIRAIVVKIAKEKGYDYVFEKETMLFGGDDLTPFVTKEMNK